MNLFALVVAGSSASAFLNSITVFFYYQWFLRPLGAPPITLAHAAAFFVFSVFITRADLVMMDEDLAGLERFLAVLVRPVVAICLGYILAWLV